MANLPLEELIGGYRDELTSRCKAKVAARSAPQHTDTETDHGVPLFLDQLCRANTSEIIKSATEHGHGDLGRRPALPPAPRP
jgi:hypothetical protein